MDPRPDFLIVGAKKAATTSLYYYLRQHPQICLSEDEECHFFTTRWSEAVAEGGEGLDAAWAWYEAQFHPTDATRIVGEKTATYLPFGTVLDRIVESLPDVRVVACLRDPIQRAHSDYHFRKTDIDFAGLPPFHQEVRDDWARTEAARAAGGDAALLEGYLTEELGLYVEMGRYGTHVERYVQALGRERVHVILVPELRKDPKGVLRELCGFLGVDLEPVDDIDTERAHLVTRTARNDLAGRLRASGAVRGLARAVLPLRTRQWIDRTLLMRKGGRGAMDPGTKRWLQGIFEPEIAKLEGLLGRDLPELRASWDEPRGPDPASDAPSNRST